MALPFHGVLLQPADPKKAYEYLWNCTASLHGGLGHNIPNDNLVEIFVHSVKKKFIHRGRMPLIKVLEMQF